MNRSITSQLCSVPRRKKKHRAWCSALFLTCFFFGGSWAEHVAEADPDLTLIVTVDCAVDPGACEINCIVADPDALV